MPRSLCCAEYAKGKSFSWERDVSCCGNERLMEFEGPVIFILWDGSFVVQKHRWNVTWLFGGGEGGSHCSKNERLNLGCFARRLNMIELPRSSRSRMIRMIEMCHVESCRPRGRVVLRPMPSTVRLYSRQILSDGRKTMENLYRSMNFGHLWTRRTVGTTSEKYQQDSTKGT